MILITVLTLIALVLIVTVIVAISVGGAVTILFFGDVIVCIVFIVLLIRFLMK